MVAGMNTKIENQENETKSDPRTDSVTQTLGMTFQEPWQLSDVRNFNDDEPVTFEESGLDWNVLKYEAPAISPDGTRSIPDPTSCKLVLENHDIILGTQSSKYTPIQNKTLWNIAINSLNTSETVYNVVRSGYFSNGKYVFLTVKLLNHIYEVDGDDYAILLTFSSSHNGEKTFHVTASIQRESDKSIMTFDNTHVMNDNRCSIRHTIKANEHLTNQLIPFLDSAIPVLKGYIEGLELLSENAVTEQQALLIFLGMEGTEKISVQAANKANDLICLFRDEVNTGGASNAISVWNSLIHYWSSTFKARTNTDQLESSMFLYGAKNKAKAFDLFFGKEGSMKIDTLGWLATKGSQAAKASKETSQEILSEIVEGFNPCRQNQTD